MGLREVGDTGSRAAGWVTFRAIRGRAGLTGELGWTDATLDR